MILGRLTDLAVDPVTLTAGSFCVVFMTVVLGFMRTMDGRLDAVVFVVFCTL